MCTNLYSSRLFENSKQLWVDVALNDLLKTIYRKRKVTGDSKTDNCQSSDGNLPSIEKTE
jgi:hypothetical protein